jgi:hypothetical protein
VPLVAGALAVCGVGVGTAFGLIARGTWAEVGRACPNRTCPDAATQAAMEPKRSEATAQANIATGAFLVAGIAAAIAVATYLLEAGPRKGSLSGQSQGAPFEAPASR